MGPQGPIDLPWGRKAPSTYSGQDDHSCEALHPSEG